MYRAVLQAVLAVAVASTSLGVFEPSRESNASQGPLGPCALVADPKGKILYVGEALARRIDAVDPAAGSIVASIALPATPTGLALSKDGARLFATMGDADGSVAVIDTTKREIVASLPAGHGACAPALRPDGAEMFVCNRFDNDVSVIGLASGKETARIAVSREPAACAVTPDGSTLFVANHLPAGRADADTVAAVVSAIDVASRRVLATIELPNGSGGVRGICCSPDGRRIYVTHILARYGMPTTQVARGWMNTNALSVIDAGAKALVATVLLDDVDLGAANPWGVGCSADGRTIAVAHAGTHEVSLIDAPALLRKLESAADGSQSNKGANVGGLYTPAASPPARTDDLSFLVGLRVRVPLQGKGPRALAVVGKRVYAAEYFSDGLGVVDLAAPRPAAVEVSLAPGVAMSEARRGELAFNDAALCFQTWQSCASCHPDGRADGLNWDLMNDGLGNPKNVKSLLLAPQTPPAMAHGVRADAAAAVRSGIRFIQFAERPESDAQAIDAYLKSLAPVPSPRLMKGGQLSPAAERGKALFHGEAACATCHPAPLYTDLQSHDVGTKGRFDTDGSFDTPTLVEVWRTAPYLHDGRCVTIEETLTAANPADRHGHTSHLTKEQLADLVEFVLSL